MNTNSLKLAINEHRQHFINFEAEQSVIGSLLIDNSCYERIRYIQTHHFNTPVHAYVWEEATRLLRAGTPVDLITLSDVLDSNDRLEQSGGFAYLADLVKNTPSAANVKAYAAILVDRYSRLVQVRAHYSQLKALLDFEKPASEHLVNSSNLLNEIRNRGGSSSGKIYKHIDELAEEWSEELEERFKNGGAGGLTLGLDGLDNMLHPKQVVGGSLFVVGARPKMGKAQPLDSNILLADGTWKLMGDIELGDKLASVDGKPSRVTGIFPQGLKDVYEVEFSDGRKVECCPEHLWTVRSSKFPDYERTLTTADLMDKMSKVRYTSRIHIPAISGDFGGHVELGINPWILGALLGDGCLVCSTPKFTAAEGFMLDKFKLLLPDGFELRKDGDIDYRVVDRTQCGNSMLDALRSLGLDGVKSNAKFVPEAVFSASRDIRAGVLAGLLESDGWVEKSGAFMFSSASERLRDGVVRLAWSLGATARTRMRDDVKYTYKGKTLKGQDSYMATMRFQDVRELIDSPRLLTNVKEVQKKTASPVIKSVTKKRIAECQCIMVDHPDHLYATDNYIMTHNTSLAIKIIDHMTRQGLCTQVFSMEMTGTQLVERSLVQIGNVSTRAMYPTQGEFQAPDEDLAKVLHTLQDLRGRDLHISVKPAVSLDEMEHNIRALYGESNGRLKAVWVDYLTLMDVDQVGSRTDLPYAKITQRLKVIAKELDLVVFLLIQLNRGLESRADKRPMPSDGRETGQIEQDCDYWLGIYRDHVYNPDADPNFTELLMRLNRHGNSGTAYASFAGGRFDDWRSQPPMQKVATHRNEDI